jgi:hypothetical protein
MIQFCEPCGGRAPALNALNALNALTCFTGNRKELHVEGEEQERQLRWRGSSQELTYYSIRRLGFRRSTQRGDVHP